MNPITQLSSRTQSSIDAGSLTAQWLLWGLPERLGVAAPRAHERFEIACPPRQLALAPIRTAA